MEPGLRASHSDTRDHHAGVRLGLEEAASPSW